jgi:hypothetical protein
VISRSIAARAGFKAIVKRALREHRREAGRQQHRVALAQRQLEMVAEVEQHVAAGRGPAGLDEAQVPGRDLGVEREVELAHAALQAPFAQPLSNGGHG